MLKKQIVTLAILMFATTACDAAPVVENAREIPVVHTVDVVVVGGSTRAVAAAVAAKKAGASVFLMARRTYLGGDMCATYRLWLEEGEKPTSELAKSIYANGVPTPVQVKRVLDEALLNAKIDFLYGCYPTDVLRGDKGALAGVVMANRSGRQAVRAKVIIDATDRGIVARLAGAQFAPYPVGKQTFKRIVLGGEPNKDAKTLPLTIEVKSDSRRRRVDTTYHVYEYTVDVPMKDGSWTSFAKAEQMVRGLSWQDGQADASESLFQVPPDPVVAQASQAGAWQGADKVNLNALHPQGFPDVYILSGSAAVSRAAAERIMRPVNGIELGSIVGADAATVAKGKADGQGNNLVVSGKAGGTDVGEIGEMLKGLRSKPTLAPVGFVKSPTRSIPVLARYDVVVVGGGTGGAPAGISAARAGAKTLVLEYLDGLGGIGTMGRISNYYHGNQVGFTKEIDDAVGGGKWNVEKKMEWYRSEIVKAGGDIWLHTLGCGSVLKGNRFVGVVVATPHGRGVVLANTVIDSTGNSVIPAYAGIPCQEIGGKHISVQGTGLPTFSPGVSYLNGDWTFNDDDDVLDMWRMFVVAKQKYKTSYSGYDIGQLITTRARRRIIGDIVITPMDVINERTYPDTITLSKSNFDNHGFSSHDLFMIISPRSRVANVPYRALMPKGYDGLLVTGLGISAHGDAMPVLRMQADVQNQGYAAGYAAAMVALDGTTVRKVNIKELQKHLVDKKVLDEEVLAAKDSYPITSEVMAQAIDQVGENYEGISKVLTDVPRALPLLKTAYGTATDTDKKLRYAHVLGMLGDSTGAEAVIGKLSNAEWDKGWNFRGMGQYGPTTSYVDNLVIALGRTRDKRGLDAILRMAGKLSNESEFSHQRAVAIACETLHDPRAAKPLYDLLMQDGMTGHAFTQIDKAIEQTPPNPGDVSTRRKSLPELVLARALYRCGDHNGLAKNILTEYAKDLRGHYATHAKAILAETKK